MHFERDDVFINVKVIVELICGTPSGNDKFIIGVYMYIKENWYYSIKLENN